jgi:cytochrome c oxidase subunit 2
VGRSRWARGGRTAVLLAGLALLLSGCSRQAWEKRLRFGWPTGVTKQATEMRELWTWAGVAALILGVIVWGLIFWCCIRYRKKSDELPRQTKYNFAIEATCVVIPLLIIAGLFYRTVVVEDDVNRLGANPAVQVEVDAFKWGWQFQYDTYRYNGAQTATQLVYPGLKDPTDSQKGHPYHLSTVGSQYEIPVLVIPVHQSVRFREQSFDVIHSFWVPEFLFKRDVIPYGVNANGSYNTSRDNQFQINATSTGAFVGRCAELCGTYHSQMNFEVRVVAKSTFVKYLAALKSIGPNDPDRQAKALRMSGQKPYATTTYPLDTNRTARVASQRGDS